MAGITLQIAEQKLAQWLDADAKVSAGQSVRISSGGTDRQLTRADAAEIRSSIEYWNGWCQRLSPGSSGRTGIEAVGVEFE